MERLKVPSADVRRTQSFEHFSSVRYRGKGRELATGDQLVPHRGGVSLAF